jgi:hypothetical protein
MSSTLKISIYGCETEGKSLGPRPCLAAGQDSISSLLRSSPALLSSLLHESFPEKSDLCPGIVDSSQKNTLGK